MSDPTQQIAEFLEQLVERRHLPVSLWPLGALSHEQYGLRCVDGSIVLGADVEVLEASAVKANLSAAVASWLQQLDVYRALGSTNGYLMDQAQQGSVDGWICLADVQIQGRGRRGRRWMSPFAQNLAMSLGITVGASPATLGGLSLAVGLAAVDCLGSLGVRDVRLKWPNDLLLEGGKLGGILLELVSGAEVQVVIGIGLNLQLTEVVRREVDQVVADLSSHGYRVSRNVLAGRLASSIVDYVRQFESGGFAPMREAYEAHHHFQDRRCRIVSGKEEVVGVVSGVSETGALILETSVGPRSFVSGDVSLREAN
ncbi:MAG: biotin--[acetyl-CoA-carboxylase] ligase [Gammaproteobacteria bacterium]|nr:biotin--[acetyl-CoA-carboxylase] ligase [Gammaproteobacteria bacterium]